MSAVDEIKKLAGQPASREGLEQATKLLVGELGTALGVRAEGDIGILVLNATGNLLKFVAPVALYKASASFPVGQKDSLATGVLQTKKGKVDNKFTDSKHLKFFEMTKFGKEREKPIQKVLALPLMNGANAAGVIEICRKGATPDEAGANFTPDDAQKALAALKPLLTDYFRTIPKDFL